MALARMLAQTKERKLRPLRMVVSSGHSQTPEGNDEVVILFDGLVPPWIADGAGSGPQRLPSTKMCSRFARIFCTE